HDFNNLLAIVIGNLDFLQQDLVEFPDHQNLVEAALRASLRGADLTRQLLAFARKQQLSPKLIDLNELIADTASLLERTLGELIEIRINRERDLWPVQA